MSEVARLNALVERLNDSALARTGQQGSDVDRQRHEETMRQAETDREMAVLRVGAAPHRAHAPRCSRACCALEPWPWLCAHLAGTHAAQLCTAGYNGPTPRPGR